MFPYRFSFCPTTTECVFVPLFSPRFSFCPTTTDCVCLCVPPPSQKQQALYESILVEPQFALFFLQRLAGKLNETDDLYSLDPELYRHIMSLKHIKNQGGNIADLALNFEVTTQDDMQQSMVSQFGGVGRVREEKLSTTRLEVPLNLHFGC